MRKDKQKRGDEDNSMYCIFVKLAVYYRQYLRIKYGGPRIILPASGLMGMFLRSDNALIRTDASFRPESRCVSQLAFTQALGCADILGAQRILEPGQEEEYLGFVLPQKIMVGRLFYDASPLWTLRQGKDAEFHKLIKHEFWNDCISFIGNCSIRAHARGEVPNKEDAISDFMVQYDIPMTEYENMIRYEKRWLGRITAEIEANRERMASMTGREFLYT